MTHSHGPLFDYPEIKEAKRREKTKTLDPAIQQQLDAFYQKAGRATDLYSPERAAMAFDPKTTAFPNDAGKMYSFRPFVGGQADRSVLSHQNITEFADVYQTPARQGARRIFDEMLRDGLAFWVDREDVKTQKTETALGLVVAWPGLFRGGNQETFRQGALYLNAHWHDHLQRCGSDIPLVLQKACAFIFKMKPEVGLIVAQAAPDSPPAKALQGLQKNLSRDHVSDLALVGTLYAVSDLDLLGLAEKSHACHISRKPGQECLNPPVDVPEKIFDRRHLNYI